MSEKSDEIVHKIKLKDVTSHPTIPGGSIPCRSVCDPWRDMGVENRG